MNHTRRIAKLLGCLVLAAPVMAEANPAVALDSAVFVERSAKDQSRMLEPARTFRHGDRLVYVLNWYRMGGQGGFTVTNPLPRSVYYQGSANGLEEVSVDGGKTWGRIGTLKIGGRLATVEDVTHVRWRVEPGQAARGSGRIAYSAIVR